MHRQHESVLSNRRNRSGMVADGSEVRPSEPEVVHVVPEAGGSTPRMHRAVVLSSRKREHSSSSTPTSAEKGSDCPPGARNTAWDDGIPSSTVSGPSSTVSGNDRVSWRGIRSRRLSVQAIEEVRGDVHRLFGREADDAMLESLDDAKQAKCLVLPDNQVRVVFDMMLVGAMLWVAVVVPMRTAWPVHHDHTEFIFWFEITVDACFLLDVGESHPPPRQCRLSHVQCTTL